MNKYILIPLCSIGAVLAVLLFIFYFLTCTIFTMPALPDDHLIIMLENKTWNEFDNISLRFDGGDPQEAKIIYKLKRRELVYIDVDMRQVDLQSGSGNTLTLNLSVPGKENATTTVFFDHYLQRVSIVNKQHGGFEFVNHDDWIIDPRPAYARAKDYILERYFNAVTIHWFDFPGRN